MNTIIDKNIRFIINYIKSIVILILYVKLYLDMNIKAQKND